MSLSDYSSDDSFDAEDSQASQEAVTGLQKAEMSARGSRASDGGFSTMFLGAMAALAVAGVAAGTLYMRQRFPGRRPAAAGAAEEGGDRRRKDLRRKRGEVKESPGAQPFMARTESTSSVGPLRKHPRRDTSEESGGEASGSSPTATGSAGKPRSLRKTTSKHRHRRPPLRAPACEGHKEASEGEEAGDTMDAQAQEGDQQTEAVDLEQEGSRVVPMPAESNTAGSGKTGKAAERPAANSAADPHQKDSKEQATEEAVTSAAESARVGDHPVDNASSAAEPSSSEAAAEKVQEAAPAEPAHGKAKSRSLPDLLGESYSVPAATQPSLETFTADCDILDQAVDAVGVDAKQPGEEEATKGPEQAPSKDDKKGHGKQHDAQEVEVINENIQGTTEEKRRDSKGEAASLQKEGEGEIQDSAVALGEREPEEAAAVREPDTESKPESRGGATGLEKGAGEEPAQAQEVASMEMQPKAQPAGATAAEHEDSASKPEDGERTREESAEQEMPTSGTPEGNAEPAESESGPQSRVSQGGEPGKGQASVSDEQKAILERGGSLLAEADEHDPKGIQLIRHMQAEVDKQDNMLDFSKTDAYRSSKTRQSQDQPGAAASQGSPPADTAHEESNETSHSDPKQDSEGAVKAADEPEQAQPALETEPSLQLLADTAPAGEELDLSSAEVATVANITSEGPEQAETKEQGAKTGKPAAEEEPETKGTPHTDAPTIKPGEGAAQRETVKEKSNDEGHHEEETSKGQPGTVTPAHHKLLGAEAQSGYADREAQQRPPPASDKEHAGKLPQTACGVDQSHAEEQPDSKAFPAEPAVQEDAGKGEPESAQAPSTLEQGPTKGAPDSSKPEQGTTPGTQHGFKPNGTLKAPTEGEHLKDEELPKSVPADKAAMPEEATLHCKSPLADVAAGAAAVLATEDRDALISSQPSVGTLESGKPAASGSMPNAKKSTGSLTDSGEAEAAAAKAPYDPLGMDTPDEASGAAEAMPSEGAAAEAGEDAAMARNSTERDVQLNLAVALRMIEERGNVAAAERTLQKQLGAVKESKESIRPEYMQRLVGTLADVIARAVHQEVTGGKHSPSQPDRLPEIITLLQTAFESAKAAGDSSRSREGWRLGNALLQADKLDEAEALFKEEITYSEEHLGAQSPNTQQTRTYLAEVLAKKGNKAEAYKLLSDASEQLEQQAKEVSSSKGGESKPDGGDADTGLTAEATAMVSAAKCSVKLATMQDEDKQYKDAEASARRAVRLMEAAFGANNPRNSTAYGTLAAILKHVGGEKELREAIQLYTQLQHTMEDIHGLRNAQSALALRSIADVHLMLKEYGEAIQCLEKARQIAASVHGRDHPILESFWEALAEAKKEAGDKQGAKEASRQALLVKSHAHRPGGGQRSPRETGAPRRGRGRSRR